MTRNSPRHESLASRRRKRQQFSPSAGNSRGALVAALASDQGFVLDDDANAFFTTADIFAQLQVSEPSSQLVVFGRPTGRLAAVEAGFLGIKTIGGPIACRALSRSALSCSPCLFASSAEIPSRRWASRKAIY